MSATKKRTMKIRKIEEAIERTIAHLREQGLEVDEPVLETTLQTWKTFYETQKKKLRQPKYTKAYLDEEKKQLQEEKNFLAQYNSCGGEKYLSTEEIQARLGNLDMARFGKMLTGNFYDDNTMNSMVCLSGAAYLATSSSLAPNERIRTWVRNLRRVGADSISGYALLGDAGYGNGEAGTAKSPFIVKALRNTEKSGELMHEVFVGLAATNHLRKFVPNFAYIYGLFECSPPLAGPLTEKDPTGKNIATFCNTRGQGNDTVQAVYENIAPARSFREALITMDGPTFMRHYLSILMALHKGYEIFEFSLYDMHDENVLLRQCLDERYLEAVKRGTNSFYVPYTLKLASGVSSRYYIPSDGEIPVIIDLGRAHVKVAGQHYGMPDSLYYTPDGTFRDRGNPMYDAYKLLGFALASCLMHNNLRLLAQIAPLFRYFNTHEGIVDELVTLREETYYELPYLTNNEDLEAFIEYVINYSEAMGYEEIVTTKPPLGALILVPVSERLEVSVLEKAGLNQMNLALPRPRTVLEAYDVLSKYVKGYAYYDEEEKKEKDREARESYRYQKTVLLRSYRAVREAFARPRSGGRSDLEQALTYEEERLATLLSLFAEGVLSASKAKRVVADFRKGKEVGAYINKKLFLISLPSSIEAYFDERILVLTKNYIGKIALFTELRQSVMVSLRGLNYLRTAYTIVAKSNASYPELLSKVAKLYSYLYHLVDSFEPLYQEYASNLHAFTKLFKGLRKEYMDVKQVDEDYAWYFNTAVTVPSLLQEWSPLKKALTPPIES